MTKETTFKETIKERINNNCTEFYKLTDFKFEDEKGNITIKEDNSMLEKYLIKDEKGNFYSFCKNLNNEYQLSFEDDVRNSYIYEKIDKDNFIKYFNEKLKQKEEIKTMKREEMTEEKIEEIKNYINENYEYFTINEYEEKIKEYNDDELNTNEELRDFIEDISNNFKIELSIKYDIDYVDFDEDIRYLIKEYDEDLYEYITDEIGETYCIENYLFVEDYKSRNIEDLFKKIAENFEDYKDYEYDDFRITRYDIISEIVNDYFILTKDEILEKIYNKKYRNKILKMEER